MLKIRRGETPFYRWLRDTARRIVSSNSASTQISQPPAEVRI